MTNKLQSHINTLKAIDNQRKAWLMLSALVVVTLGFIIFDSAHLVSLNILWTIGILGIVLAAVWWYWAMRIINKLVILRVSEVEVLRDLCSDVKELKEDIRKNIIKSVD